MIQKERILYWDVIKAFAIFLVVWGHCLQYLQVDTEKCWNSYTCGFIYSFHMPLFMMVSGYFGRSIYKRSLAENLKHKSLQILLPSVSTYIVVGILLIYLRHEPWGYGLEKLGWNSFTSYWFLKALYILYVVGILFTSIYRKAKWLAWLSVVLLLGILRDDVEFVHCMSMAPFFLIGMLLYRYEGMFWKNQNLIVLVSVFICIVMCSIYDIVDYNMYMHPFRFCLSSLYLFGVRTIIGIFASLLCVIVIRKICDSMRDTRSIKTIAKVGTMTLGIYVFHREMALLSNRFAAKIEALNVFSFSNLGGQLFYEYGICLLASILFILVSIWIILLLRKNKYTKLIFFGEK